MSLNEKALLKFKKNTLHSIARLNQDMRDWLTANARYLAKRYVESWLNVAQDISIQGSGEELQAVTRRQFTGPIPPELKATLAPVIFS